MFLYLFAKLVTSDGEANRATWPIHYLRSSMFLCNNLYLVYEKSLFEWSARAGRTKKTSSSTGIHGLRWNKRTHTHSHTKQSGKTTREEKRRKKRACAMIYSEIHHLYYLFILICGYGNEFSFLEHVRTERGVGQLQNVVGSYQMKTWLIFVHRIQYGL